MQLMFAEMEQALFLAHCCRTDVGTFQGEGQSLNEVRLSSCEFEAAAALSDCRIVRLRAPKNFVERASLMRWVELGGSEQVQGFVEAKK